jgi:antitoxin CptB
MSETSRLRWLCRRGMKELDVVLTRYLDESYQSADAADQALFRQLLEMPDPDLYNLLLGRSSADDPEIERFLRQLQR